MTYVCLLSVPHCLWLAATIKALELYFSCMCACISYCWMHNLARLACLRMVSSSTQIVKSVCEFHDYDTISILSGWSIELLMSYILLHLIVGIYGIWEFGNQEWSQRSPNFMNTSYVAYSYKLLIPPQVGIYGNHLFFHRTRREKMRLCVPCVSMFSHAMIVSGPYLASGLSFPLYHDLIMTLWMYCLE